MVNTTFEHIEESVENYYPYPIAAVFNRFRQIPGSDYSTRQTVLCDIFESIVKFTAVVLVQEARQQGQTGTLKKVFPRGLDFLKRPSLGHWLSIIRELTRADSSLRWSKQIRSWYLDNELKIDRSVVEGLEIHFERRQPPVAALFASLGNYRNKRAHGASISGEALAKSVEYLEFALAFLLESAAFFCEMDLFYVYEVVERKNSREVRVNSLRGVRKGSKEYKSETPPNPSEIYLCALNDQHKVNHLVQLSPLVEWRPKVGFKNESEFYFFNNANRTNLEFLSYVDGQNFYHRDLKPELGAIIDGISLEKIENKEDYEYIIYNFTEEERKEKGRELYDRGLELAAKQQWESALMYYEEALIYQKSPEVILSQCKALKHLDENPDDIEFLLEDCFSIDPDYAPAYGFLRELRGESAATAIPIHDYFDPQEPQYTYLDYSFFLIKLVIAALFQKIYGVLPVNAPLAGRDLKDPIGLLSKLRNNSNPLSCYLWNQLSPELVEFYEEEYKIDGRQRELTNLLAKDLNRIIRKKEIFGEDGFVDKLPPGKRFSIFNTHKHLSRTLLEVAFPDEIMPFKDRIKNVILNTSSTGLSTLFWVFTVTAFYVSSTAFLFLYNEKKALSYVPAASMFMFQCLAVAIGITVGKNWFVESYFSLVSQMDNVRRERANQWYRLQFDRIFGFFVSSRTADPEDILHQQGGEDGDKNENSTNLNNTKNIMSIRLIWEKEKFFLIPFFLFVIVWSLAAFQTQQLYTKPWPFILVQFLDTTMIWIWTGLAIRYVIFSTSFIKDYSNFTLHPVISKLGNSGFKAITSFFLLNLGIFVFFWVTNWGWNALLVHDPTYLDMVGLALGIIVAVFWTIVSPMFIFRAIRLSKSIAVADYQSHVRKAFKEFIKTPNEDNRRQLDWILKNEDIISKISTRVLSKKHVLFIFISNVIFLVSSLIYSSVRLNFFDKLVTYISSVF